MWFVVQTDNYQEAKAKSFLLDNVKGIEDVYVTPTRKVSFVGRNGTKKEISAPILVGFVFAYVKYEEEKKKGRRKDKVWARNKSGEKKLVYRQLMGALSPYGYFKFKTKGKKEGEREPVREKVSCHLLCSKPQDTPLNEMLEQARISDATMDAFKVFTNQAVNSSDDLRVETETYTNLIKERDIVRVIRGPFVGMEGVVKRVSNKENGRKHQDRRLFISFGSDLCISISGIHQNDIVIVHEATGGKDAKAVSLYRDIDAVIGYLQNHGHADDAPSTLRQLVKSYNAKGKQPDYSSMSDAERLKVVREYEHQESTRKKDVLSQIAQEVTPQFKALCEYLSSEVYIDAKTLKEYIPDSKVRPFLTPTPGTEIGKEGYAILQHKDFVEYIVKRNLSSFFMAEEYDKKKYTPMPDEDYEYYAHVAIVDYRNMKLAIAPWGGFYDKYAILSNIGLEEFYNTLEAHRYDKFLSLLPPLKKVRGEVNQNVVDFKKRCEIGGFVMQVEGDELTAMNKLIDIVTPAAVEIWQGTRLQVWRQLLQKYVLLHKVPILDLPSVITDSKELDHIFSIKDNGGNPDIQAIAKRLNEMLPVMTHLVDDGRTFQAVSLFLQTAKHVGTCFVDDEFYNYLNGKRYEPDDVCTKMYNSVMVKLNEENVLKYLNRGIAELELLDSWRYFKIPSFLKKVEK